MSNDRFTPQEQELLKTQEGAYAVIMGYLKSERGRIAPSVFNKLVLELGYHKLKKSDLVDFAKELQKDPDLTSLYNKAFERTIKLEDLTYKIEDPDSDVPFTIGLREQDIFAQVTNFLIDNEDNNARLRELRKLQREGVYMELLMRGLRKHLVEELKGMPRAKYLKTEVPEARKGDKSLILCFSDWHIGFMSFNMATGDYNFQRLTTSLQEIKDMTKQLIAENDIKKLYIVHLGDLTEKVDMRNVSQAYDAQFPFAEQISKGLRVLVDLLSDLSKFVHVTFTIVGGNHDRMTGGKDTVNNDSSAYIVLDALFTLQDSLGQLPNVTLVDNRSYIYRSDIYVAGSHIVCVHGDKGFKSGRKIPLFTKEELIDFLLSGHLHNFMISQEDYHRLHIQTGSTIGENSYSKEHNFPSTAPSQTIIILREGYKTPTIIPVMLSKEGKIM